MPNTETDTKAGEGIQYAEISGRRSSFTAAKAIFASAVRGVDAKLARDIEATKDWRKGYLAPVRRVVESGVSSPESATRVAADGLAAVRDHLVYVRGRDDLPLATAFRDLGHEPTHTTVVKGEGDAERQIVVPYRGVHLRGDRLRAQLERWTNQGVMEPSAAAALGLVIANPDWLNLSDHTFVLLGASSEMGSLEHLSKWRGNIAAVDLPRPHLWEMVLDKARRGAGRVYVPSSSPATEADVMRKAGADLLVDAPRIARWIAELDGPLTLGNYVYADGANFVRLASAVDGLITSLLESRDDVSSPISRPRPTCSQCRQT